jgi:RimJ/RimL family protein N-acetyltransferase
LLTPAQAETLRSWFEPERPGPLIGSHVLNTGNGAIFVDRWPEPRAALAEIGGNYALRGDPHAFAPDDLRPRTVGFIDAPRGFEPTLRAAFPALTVWDRVIADCSKPPPEQPAAEGARIRRLVDDDTYQVFGLAPEISWIAVTWGGRPALAASGYAWGAFVDDRLVSVACSFFVGSDYEDIGVVTEADYRGRGFSTACAAHLCADIFARGKRASWSTTPDNVGSLHVAQNIGFVEWRRDHLLKV